MASLDGPVRVWAGLNGQYQFKAQPISIIGSTIFFNPALVLLIWFDMSIKLRVKIRISSFLKYFNNNKNKDVVFIFTLKLIIYILKLFIHLKLLLYYRHWNSFNED